MKTKKKKLLTVKEARTRVELLEAIVYRRDLDINRLENEVQSLEGARLNLKMMYDSHEMEMNNAKADTVKAMASVRQLNEDFSRVASLAQAFQTQVRYYEAETAGHMFKRSIKKAFEPIRKSVRSFFERLKFGRKKAF